MKWAAPVAERLPLAPQLAGAELPEVFRRPRRQRREELDLHSACSLPGDGHVQKHDGMTSTERFLEAVAGVVNVEPPRPVTTFVSCHS